MMEMVETASIVQRATPRSFVVVDELGRGTAVSDGLAVASAVISHLARLQCRTLFATHLHHLAASLPTGAAAYHVAPPLEHGTSLVFSHAILPGYCNQSHGLAVAKLAGMPAPLLAHAHRIRDGIQKCALASPSPTSTSATTTLTFSITTLTPGSWLVSTKISGKPSARRSRSIEQESL